VPFNRPITDTTPRTRPASALASLVQAEKWMHIVFVLPATAFAGWLAGAWLDKHLHQEWIAVTGILLGGVAGLVYVVRLGMVSAGKTAEGTGNNGNGKGNGPEEGGSGDEP
jgi:F0F1-type ATP synthase assembly protein I